MTPITDMLTKENFWDALKEKYPATFNEFMIWLTNYKASVEWGILFSRSHGFWSIKYHEMPIAIQYGIFLQWVTQDLSGSDFVQEVKTHIESVMYSFNDRFTVSDDQ